MISWPKWTGVNLIFCWLLKRGGTNMKERFLLLMATGFSGVAAQLVDVVLEFLLGNHCIHACQT